MDITEALNTLGKKVSRIQDIDVMKFKTKDSMKNWISIMKSSYGVTENIVDGNAEFDGRLFFLLRCEVHYMKEQPTRWSNGYVASTNLLSVSDNLDRAVLLMESFLQANSQYFVKESD